MRRPTSGPVTATDERLDILIEGIEELIAVLSSERGREPAPELTPPTPPEPSAPPEPEQAAVEEPAEPEGAQAEEESAPHAPEPTPAPKARGRRRRARS